MTQPASGRQDFDPLRSEVLSTGVFQRPGTILLIDPDSAFVTEFMDQIQRQAHSVLSAPDGRAGLKLAEDERPDIIVCEVRLPEVDGFEVCQRIKNHPDLRYCPVILVAANATTETHVRAMDAGANDFHDKPIDWVVFNARIWSLLKYRRAVAALRSARAQLEQRVFERTAELQAANQKLKAEIAERERIEKALRESEERYALAARGANDGLWDWDLVADRLYYSPRWKAMLGEEEHAVGDKPEEWFGRVHTEDVESLRADIRATINGVTTHLQHEFRLLYKDGTYRWMLCRGMPVRNSEGKAFRMAGSMSDITVRKMAELQLLHNAFHDELTGLPNRALFMDRLGHALERLQFGREDTLAVFFLDIDRFKIVNDGLGHKVGNQLLIEFGRRVRRCLRPSDTVARLGGDEFAVLLEDIRGIDDAANVATQIRESLREPFQLTKRDVFVTTSIGILMGKKRYTRAEDLLRDAETAMHRAKSMGKARHEMFNSGMHAQVVTLLHLENDLRRAVEQQEFVLHYQPIVSLQTGKLSGFEALIRWKHPERGMVSPGEFIPLAEETDLITPMTLWVLREACTQLKAWQQKHAHASALTVSVNLSGKTCEERNIVEKISQIIAETAVNPGMLKMEITEGTIMQHEEKTSAVLAELKAMRMQLMIDDFGTGYSSLSYLHRLPIDVLKIDRSFVSNMELGNKNSEIVRTILSLASNLGMKTVAEGVENAAQAEALQGLECNFAQGYYFARPAAPADMEKYLSAAHSWPLAKAVSNP